MALRVDALHVRERQRVADAGHDVLALGVLEVVAVDPHGAGGRVAGEGNPDPESIPRLPKTMAWTLTAVPRSDGIRSRRR